MRTSLAMRALLVGALAAATLGACGDDDDETATGGSATTTTAAESGGGAANELKIEMVDYAYKVTGKLKAGRATITSTNAGTEWHMAGFGKLKEGATVDQLVKALQSGGGGESESQGDPLAQFIEKELDTPGHLLQPGSTQSLTVDVFEPGTYVMLCFLPAEGEGTPHFAKGMVNSFTVEAGESGAAEPEADATVTLGDEAEPAGLPTDLKGGRHTIKVTATGKQDKDFVVAQLKPGKAVDDFDTYFESFENGQNGPPKGAAAQAPGQILGSTFAIQPGETLWLTVDVPKGETYFVSTTNNEDAEGNEEGVDKFVKVNVA